EHRLLAVLVANDDGDGLARLQRREDGAEHVGRRRRLPGHRDDHVARVDTGLRRRTAGRYLADVNALAAGIAHADAEVGAVRVDDLPELDELSGDVSNEVARDCEADAGGAATELRVGRGEGGSAEPAAAEGGSH